MSNSAWRQSIVDYIRKEATPADKFGHQPRLYHLSTLVGKGLDYDDDVVFAAAWMHDLGVFLGHRPADPVALAKWDNTAYVMAKAPAILEQFGFPKEKIAAVVEAVRTHQPFSDPSALEGTILRDADILEQLGAVGISRMVVKVGRDTRYSVFSDVLPVLQRALEQLPGMLRLPNSLPLAEPRIKILKDFLSAAQTETDGKPF